MVTNNSDNYAPVQYNVIVGAANGAISSVAPSATSGVPVISQGASANPTFGTVAIAGGGTNATSMATSTGIVKYDGTSLVTSSTAKIDSSNRTTNSSQPCFKAHLGSNVANVTGDGTVYTVICDTEDFDQGSNYDNTTGIFTAPVTGKYFFSATAFFDPAGTNVGFFSVILNATSGSIGSNFNYLTTNAGQRSGFTCTSLISMTANDTCQMDVVANIGTKSTGVHTSIGFGTGQGTYFSGFLVC